MLPNGYWLMREGGMDYLSRPILLSIAKSSSNNSRTPIMSFMLLILRDCSLSFHPIYVSFLWLWIDKEFSLDHDGSKTLERNGLGHFNQNKLVVLRLGSIAACLRAAYKTKGLDTPS